MNQAPLKILKASAGSGKTFSLTVHYLTLLLTNENNYKEILAVTFTNKATAEMKERILDVLEGLALDSSDSKTDAYRDVLLDHFQYLSRTDIQQKAYTVYRKILHDYSHFTISTIDGFSQKVIRNFTYELNLDAGYKIEMNNDKVKTDLTSMLNKALDEKPELLDWIISFAERRIANNQNWNYRKELNKLAGIIFSENFQEFEHFLRKTDGEALFDQLNSNIFEFTENFMKAIIAAVQQFKMVYAQAQIDPSTLLGKSTNALVSLQKQSADGLKNASANDIGKFIESFMRLKTKEKTFMLSTKETDEHLKSQFKPVIEAFEAIEAQFPLYIAYAAVKKNLYYLRLVKEMSNLLAQWRKENNAQLISDAQILLNELGLDEHQDPTFIWEKIGNRYNYFLFDEFQDTSRIQWKNYSPLLINALANSQPGSSHAHLIVGDAKQSIYRWRNGDWRILVHQVEDQMKKAFHLTPHNTQEVLINESLETNYRSLPNIIRFNNYIFTKIPQLLQQLLNSQLETSGLATDQNWWQESGNDQMIVKAYEHVEQEIPKEKANLQYPQGEIEMEYLPLEEGRSWRTTKVFELALEAMCGKVQEWIQTGKYQPKQIGILVRKNKEVKFVIDALMAIKKEQNLDFNIISGGVMQIQADDAVLLLIETIKAFAYDGEQYVLYKANIAYLYAVMKNKKAFNEDDWLLFQKNDLSKLGHLLPPELLLHWQQWQRLPIVQLIEELIRVYGLNEENNPHLAYVLTFKDVVATFAENGERGLLAFIDYWEEDGVHTVLPNSGKADAIEVVTIHKSKGLAYDVVMIPFAGMDIDGQRDGNFWIDVSDSPFQALGKIPVNYNSTLAKSIFSRQYWEEKLFNYIDALNTLYVATTRAVQHIYITAPYFEEKKDQLEVKSEYISDILYQALTDRDSPFLFEERNAWIHSDITGDATTKKIKKDEHPSKIIEEKTALTYYPLSQKLEQTMERNKKVSIARSLRLEKSAQYGIIAHEILSLSSHAGEVDGILREYVQNGLLKKEDQEAVSLQINNFWHQPALQDLLNGGYKIWNESSIITKEGETKRPDKVFTKGDEAIVIDFKFTESDYIEHKGQVAYYMDLLTNIGYKQVKGYLFYAKTNTLQAID